MARRVFLHVGPPKTGTSFLQAAWFQHRDDLAAAGVLYPGDQAMDQFRASAVALQKARVTERMSPRDLRTWDTLTDAVRSWEGDAILSSEHYAIGAEPGAQRVLSRLGEIADETHLVVTCRDLARQVPAAWQQSIKQGNDETFDAFWRGLADDESGGFWRAQDLPPMIERWSAGLPADRVHLVMHARPGVRSPLWDRVCEVTGVDPGILRPVSRANESLGVVQIEMLRRANAELPADRDRVAMGRMTKTFMALHVVGPIGDSDPITLPEEAQAWAVRRNRAMVEQLQDRGYDVVGDLDDLVPDEAPAPGRTPASVTEAEIAAIAAPAMARMMVHELERRLDEKDLRQDLRRLRRQARRHAGSGAAHDRADPTSSPGSPGLVARIRRRLQSS